MTLNPTVIAGDLKGSKIDVNPETTRPLTSRVKQSIFDTARDYLKKDTNVLDLYAGSGSFGIEALSRGVKNVVFVDRDKDVIRLLNENLTRLRIDKSKYEVIYSGVSSEIKDLPDGQSDLIFVDAPFDQTGSVPIMAILNKLSKDGILIWKIPSTFDYTEMLKKEASIRYKDQIGKNSILYLSKK